MYTSKRSKALRERLGQPEILVAPGAYDAWSARVIERHGFGAVYMSGYCASASMLGVPDLGLITGSEMADQLRRIAGATALPVIADGDTGFGGALNVMRTVRDYIAADGAAIQIEDQVSPKRCGHMEDKQVADPAEMVERLNAAVEARGDDSLVIIARTDARATHGLDEAIRRAELYRKAGADVLFVEAPRSVEEMRQIAKALPGAKLVANMVEGGKTPYCSASELQELGFAIALYPVAMLFAATQALDAALGELHSVGRTGQTPLTSFTQFNAMMGLDKYNETAARLKAEAGGPSS
jgi:2-methylisocitrate lyase-like PEP mutase family enzyme